jgi:hypothetical protein
MGRAQEELASMKVRRDDRKHDILMGLLMNHVRGKIDGQTLSTQVKSTTREVLR